jgi:hypothetical protein
MNSPLQVFGAPQPFVTASTVLQKTDNDLQKADIAAPAASLT